MSLLRRADAEMGIPTMTGQRIRGHAAGQGRDDYDSERCFALRHGGDAGNFTPAWECQKIAFERPSGEPCLNEPRCAGNTRRPTPRRCTYGQ